MRDNNNNDIIIFDNIILTSVQGGIVVCYRINSLLAVIPPLVHRQRFLSSLNLVTFLAYALHSNQWRVDLFEFCTAPKLTAYIYGTNSHRQIQR